MNKVLYPSPLKILISDLPKEQACCVANPRDTHWYLCGLRLASLLFRQPINSASSVARGIAISLVLTLTACSSNDEDELNTWIKTKRQNAVAHIEPIAPPKPFTPEAYTKAGEMDRFSPERLTQALQRDLEKAEGNLALLAAEQKRKKEVLEAFPLDAMSMMGTLQKKGELVALVKANQQLYAVKVGEHIGMNFGRITAIHDQAITIVELVQDAAGEWATRETQLQLEEKK